MACAPPETWGRNRNSRRLCRMMISPHPIPSRRNSGGRKSPSPEGEGVNASSVLPSHADYRAEGAEVCFDAPRLPPLTLALREEAAERDALGGRGDWVCVDICRNAIKKSVSEGG